MDKLTNVEIDSGLGKKLKSPGDVTTIYVYGSQRSWKIMTRRWWLQRLGGQATAIVDLRGGKISVGKYGGMVTVIVMGTACLVGAHRWTRHPCPTAATGADDGLLTSGHCMLWGSGAKYYIIVVVHIVD